jgi:hypothetical protein
MRTEKELKEVQRLDNYFHKVMDKAALDMKYYDVLYAQRKCLWEYCDDRIDCSDADDRMRVMKATETYFNTIVKIMVLEAKADAYIQFG